MNSAAELCASLGADSLAFISVGGLLQSLEPEENPASAEHRAASVFNGVNAPYCLGCFTGEYPIPTPGEAHC